MDAEAVLTMARQYQAACVLGAAAELDVFAALEDQPLGPREAAAHLGVPDAVPALGGPQRMRELTEAARASSAASARSPVGDLALHRVA